ncbi:hypothetical protein F157LOC_02311 [Pectobacterium brasiliense]|uniref:hypothetical protein n=1 Tax=Pectobacterium brasiliense TaxID=180957 RepID=UPI000CE6900F|nr:hypothetical protein [Pectobacterium brasiliense]PPE60073.1 hypothetical protein F157LOC_02311 [Pectobacterium brasiliense]
MERKVKITHNKFIEMLSDSLALYEQSVKKESDTYNAFSRASFLSVNYALESAANSFLKSVEISGELAKQLERFSTLDKFDFVLQWHTGNKLPKGSKEVQDIKDIIKRRNAMVHPKVIESEIAITSSFGFSNISALHNEVPVSANVNFFDVDSDLAFVSIKSLVAFVNFFVLEWWGISPKDAALFILPVWFLSMKPMYEMESLGLILKYKDDLGVRFLDLDDINGQMERVL